MRVLLSWLREYIELNETPQEIAERLTQGGIEVDNIEMFTPHFTGVVAAKVVTTEAHPNGQKLTIATVFDGAKEQKVVCGAANCRAGIFVAFAKEGATLYPEGISKAPLVIKETEIRGVKSPGMLCSATELGLSKTGTGIIELDGVKPGQDLASYFSDACFEVSLTPNLGHALSIKGIALELSALLGRPMKQKKYPFPQIKKSDVPFQISVEAKKLCPRYAALIVDGLTETEAPFSWKLRLERSGLHSVSPIVDAVNLVAHEIGQPLHAFDFNKLTKEIHVAEATCSETIELLSGQKVACPKGAILIKTNDHVCALGGVMGDLQTACTHATKAALFESAYFLPEAVRKAKKGLGINSEAAYRFERGVDPEGCQEGLAATFFLLQQICPNIVASGSFDIKNSLPQSKQIALRRSRASKIIGFEISAATIENVFSRLGFQAAWDGADTFNVSVPARRHDISEEIDLIEEVWRLSCGQHQEEKETAYIGSKMTHDPLYRFIQKIRNRLIAQGLQEWVTCSLIDPKHVAGTPLSQMKTDKLVSVMNPMSEEESLLRPTLLFNFIDSINHNINVGERNLASFEVGKIYLKKETKFQESDVVAMALVGSCPYLPHYDCKDHESDFFDMKGILLNLLYSLNIHDATFVPGNNPLFHPGRQAQIMVKDLPLGTVGEIAPSILRKFDVKEKILFAEINIQDLFSLPHKPIVFSTLAQFPASCRDWTITVKENVPYSVIKQAVTQEASPLMEDFQLLSIFRGEKLGPDTKNVTLRFTFRDKNKTVAQQQVDHEFESLQARVVKSLETAQ